MSSRKYRGQPQKNTRKRKVKKSTIVLLTIMLGYVVFRSISLRMQYNDLLEQRNALQTEVNQATEHQQQLSQQIEQSNSDKYIESLARKYFGLVYPDEKIYIEKEVDDPGIKE